MKLLADRAGVEIEDPAGGVDPEVVALAQSGKAMEAAKLHAELTGVDFVQAQRVVAAL